MRLMMEHKTTKCSKVSVCINLGETEHIGRVLSFSFLSTREKMHLAFHFHNRIKVREVGKTIVLNKDPPCLGLAGLCKTPSIRYA